MTFEDLGLSPEVLRAVTDAGYQTPTPIQAQAVPYVLMGRDVLGCAQTGTGKTASFTLPMIDILDSGRTRARMPRSLILEPTRELAAQVAESFERYGKYHPLSMALLIGGQSLTEQEKRLDRGVDVLIATPGRLLDLFERGRVLLADVKILVIDESDRMLDMGFMPDVERIVSLLPRIRQTLFFSATMPREIRRLADRFLMNPKELSVTPPATAAETVIQAMVEAPALPRDKRRVLRELLQQEAPTSALIFCNRKRDVGILYRSLVRHGFPASEQHGDLPQPVRMETLERFRRGDIRLLVCSDVAARGLDIPKVSHVINFDVPHNADDYIHRIGRTGRAGRSGKAFMLVTREDRKALAAITQMLGHAIERVRLADDKAPAEAPVARAEAPVERAEVPVARAEAPVAKTEPSAQPKSEPRAPKPSTGSEPEADNGGRVSKSSSRAGKQRHDSRPSAPPSGPFGEHVPAFMLRRVRHVAGA